MNPRGVRCGIRQLQRYNKAFGGGYTLRLELYWGKKWTKNSLRIFVRKNLNYEDLRKSKNILACGKRFGAVLYALRGQAVDFTNRIIYELKPYNKCSYRSALRQTNQYWEKSTTVQTEHLSNGFAISSTRMVAYAAICQARMEVLGQCITLSQISREMC